MIVLCSEWFMAKKSPHISWTIYLKVRGVRKQKGGNLKAFHLLNALILSKHLGVGEALQRAVIPKTIFPGFNLICIFFNFDNIQFHGWIHM